MIMNNKSGDKGSNGSIANSGKATALTVIMPNNANPKPIAPKVPGGGGNAKANKNPAAPSRFVECK